jgi:aminocarboxymuconate-semialdehyde decarboxylase
MNRREWMKTGVAAATGALGAAEALAQSLAGDHSYAVSGPKKAWTLPQKKTAPVSIDVHTHWAPAEYLKLKIDLGKPDNSGPVNYDMERRIRYMDASGVQMLAMSLGGFMPWAWIDKENGRKAAQVVNDAGIEVHKKYPERFVASIELPANDAEGCRKELDRVGGKPGLVMVHLPNSLGEREYLFESDFDPVWARINELNIPVFMHPLDGEGNWYSGKRLADKNSGSLAGLFPGLTNSVGETFEQATTAAKLITAGTLDKYPNLTVIFGHGAGAFPFIAGRMDWRTGGLKKPVQDYLRRYYYDSLVLYPVALKYLVDLVGSDRVMLGTDNLFGGAPELAPGNPHNTIDQAGFPDADRDLILRGNAKRLFKLS